ncbi:hypothetical protein FH608_007220 [Nonomuraea phyllanthi]|uniref:Uncharacterized protein n=1 Tax=Nonomuraea phyllanthi TaxID=2219224 RepID=A0A5C4WUH1_9ACTN|nr:hypothetical protein [Nonomuraea phyllanthi]KAB8196518.1 hypothetical protein FH608_007220 [Nonomuraea phyllanthi]QFY13766.1 hypothetical protein GBF35_50890 [Nonomuraea phyllanthi]
MTVRDAYAARPAIWPMQALRMVAAMHVAALLLQAVTAGMLMSAPGGSTSHFASGIALAVVGVAHVAVALMVRPPGGGRARYVVPPAVLLAMTAVAGVLGVLGVTAVHVPMGVMMFGGGVAQLGRVMSRP